MPRVLPNKMLPWLAPVDAASDRHGVERSLLFGVLDRETLCGTSPHLDRPGPEGTGDFGPRIFSRYAKRPEVREALKVWRPERAHFQRRFPKVILRPDEDVPEICVPADGRGWGRGGFQIDLFGDFTLYGGETNFEWCQKKLPDGRFWWMDPTQNAIRGALILSVCIVAFDGDERLATSAYNAGVAAVRHKLLSITEPAATEKRWLAADACTTGENYSEDVHRRRREFRRLLDQPT